MDSKKPWESKTVLLNAAFGLIAVATMFIPSAAGIGELIKGHAAEIGAAWSVLSIILRMISKDKIVLGD
jgi:hypothetical protein